MKIREYMKLRRLVQTATQGQAGARHAKGRKCIGESRCRAQSNAAHGSPRGVTGTTGRASGYGSVDSRALSP